MKRWVFGCFGLGLGACAAPAQQVALRPAQPLAVQHIATKPAFAERATFTAKEPGGPVLWAHLPAPARDIPVVGALTGIGAILDPTAMLGKVLGPAFVSAVDLARPVDITVSLENNDNVVMGYGVTSEAAFAEQTRSVFDLVPITDGRWRVTPKRDADRTDLACEIWQGAAPLQARLICANDAAAIAAEGPFFMSQASLTNKDVSVHLEVPRPAMSWLVTAAMKGADSEDEAKSAADVAGAKLGRGLVEQVGGELTSLAWDLTLRESSVDIAEQIELSKVASLMALAAAGQPAPHGPTPEAFWRLPSNSDLAWYSEGANPTQFRQAWAPLAKQFVQIPSAEYDPPPGFLDDVEHELEALVCRGGPYVIAHGGDLPAASKALSEDLLPEKTPKSKEQLARITAGLGGWFVLGLKDDPQAFMGALQHLVPLLKKHVPRRKGAKPETEDATDDHLDLAPLKKPSGLPKGSLHWVLRMDPNPKYVEPADGTKPSPPRAKLHLIASPQDDYVWLAVAQDEATAVRQLHATLAPAATDTLGANAELRQLAAHSVSGLGFATIAGYMGLTTSADSVKEVRDARNLLSMLPTLPNNGQTLIPFWAESDGTPSGARRITFNARLAPNAIADVLQLVMADLAGK